MNIKITIKDADTPLLFHKNELSEVESKKKNALYKQPEKKTATLKNDKNVSTQQKPVRDIKDDKNMRRTGFRSEIEEEQYAQAEKKMMQDLDKISKSNLNFMQTRPVSTWYTIATTFYANRMKFCSKTRKLSTVWLRTTKLRPETM